MNKTKGMYPNVKGKKRKIAEALVDPDDERNVTALCKDFKISRTTFYNWQKDADFLGYIDFLIDSFTTSIIPKAWKEIAKKINKGNMDAIRMLFEIKGKYKQEVVINGKIKLEDLI